MKKFYQYLANKLVKSFFLTILALAFSVSAVKAEMLVVCPNSNPADQNTGVSCEIKAGSPLFDNSTLLMPGMTLSQNLVVQNQDLDESCNLSMEVNRNNKLEDFDLADVLWTAIYAGNTAYFGEVSAQQATGLANLTDLYNSSTLSLGTLLPDSSQTFIWLVTLDGESVGNEYQGKQADFNFSLNFACGVPPVETQAETSSGQVNGLSTESFSPASPPVCNAQAPGQAPSNLIVTNVGPNTVSLSWGEVTPVTHYALVFTRSDGEVYGANNIGNVTDYTINNLAPGFTYTFEVLGVNDCQPGGRAIVTSPAIGGAVVEGRPVGPEGEVLGVAEEESQTQETTQVDKQGEVAGLVTCIKIKYFLPWIVLAVQAVLILLSEYIQRKKHHWLKILILGLLTAGSILIFNLLKECNCYLDLSLLAWFCRWYWVAAVVVTLILKVMSYIFIEEV